MEYASQDYRESMQQNLREESFVWITLDLVNRYAQESAYVSSVFSGSEDNLYNDNLLDEGVTSGESDGSITFTFEGFSSLSLSGLAITFGGTLPESITVTNGTITETITDVTESTIIDKAFDRSHTITITPGNNQPINILKIKFGIKYEFSHDVLLNTERRNTVRHINDELPLKEFSFTVHNYDRLWNEDNPQSLSRFLQERQVCHYKYGRRLLDNSIYEIDGGIVYLNSWSSNDYKANFDCVGILDYLDDNYTKGEIYPDGITLYQLAEYVLLDAGITKYELDACLRTFTVYNPLPEDSHKVCLQLIAHAGRCVLYEDRNGAVCIKSADRPQILKTASFNTATSYSNENDVITPTTVANYGSTEPDYTMADGLHYFYPEDDFVEYNNLIYFPYSDGNTVNGGISYTMNQDKSLTLNGSTEDGSSSGFTILSQYKVIDISESFRLPAGEYVFGAAKNILDSIGSYDDKTFYVRLYIKRQGAQESISSFDSLEGRTFHLIGNEILFITVYVSYNQQFFNYKLYPQIVRSSDLEVSEKQTIPVGFVSSEFSNASGTFSVNPTITINFASPGKLSEIVLNCPVAPSDFNIYVYLGNIAKDSASITNNVNPQITRTYDLICDRIVIVFTKTTPRQSIHVNNIEVVADADYTISYNDLSTTPTAIAIEDVSKLNFNLYSYTELSESETSSRLGAPSVEYVENSGGGLDAIITTGRNVLMSLSVVAGENILHLPTVSLVKSIVYSDDLEEGTITILETSSHYAKILCSRDGEVSVTGTEYVENISVYTVNVNDLGKEVNIDNPLISTQQHCDRIKDWLLDYYNNDIEYSFEYRGDPVLDADDSVFLENQFVDNNLIRIESESLSTSAGMDTSNSIIARRLRYTERINVTDLEISPTAVTMGPGESCVIDISISPVDATDRSVYVTNPIGFTIVYATDYSNLTITAANDMPDGLYMIKVFTNNGKYSSVVQVTIASEE